MAQGRNPAAERALQAALVLATAAYFALPLVAGGARADGHLAFFDDDLFYYLQIARHAAAGRLSTFDGITTTNGYHPLWMAILAVMTLAMGQGRAFFAALLALTGGLTLVASNRLARIHDQLGTPRPLAIASVLLFHLLQMFLARPGMEIALAVPLALSLLERSARLLDHPRPASFAAQGALAALVVLARLDAALLVALYVLLLARALRRAGRGWKGGAVVLVVVAGAVLAPYVLANAVLFGGLLPISGQAKQLKEGIAPSVHGLRSLFRACGVFCLVMPSGATVMAALACLRRVLARAPEPPAHGVVIGTLVAFPPLFFGAQALLSDWVFWNWYFYPLAMVAGLCPWLLGEPLLRGLARVFPAIGRRDDLARRALAAAVGAACAVLLAGTMARSSPSRNGIYVSAQALAVFAIDHAGTYGMGDRAGLTSYLLGQPLVQLEGLVADRRMLELIRARAPLTDAFRAYGIDYYVTTRGRTEGGCYVATEPKELQAGPRSARMEARLCHPPLWTFDDGTVRTLVFDARQESSR